MQVLEINHRDMESLIKEIFAHANGVIIRLSGSSMRPAILDGARVMARPLGERTLEIGDVVLVRTLQGKLIAHRIISFKRNPTGDRILIRGDAQPWSIETSLDSVIGIVTDVVIQGHNGDRLAPISSRNPMVGVAPRIKLGIISIASWLRQ